MFAHPETVTRQRGTETTDRYNNTVLSWDSPTELDLPCGVAAGGSLEPVQDARNSVESDFDVIAPYGCDVTAEDRLVIRGLTCQVQGRPFAWRNPFTDWKPATLIRAKIVEG